MNKKSQEQKACKAVIRVMEQCKGGQLRIIERPDEQERQEEAVDFIVRDLCTGSEFALEHTRIESYPHQTRDEHRFLNLLRPLEHRLSGTLPTSGHYVLTVDPGVLEGVKEGERIKEVLVAWVHEKAPALKLPSPLTCPQHYVREVPDGVPFEVTLYRFPALDGTFMLRAPSPNDLEDQRRLRIGRALEDKCPKLHRAKGPGRTSVLIFESNDIQLANSGVIGHTVVEKLSRRDDIPDEVYLVETVKDFRTVWILKEGQYWYPDIEHYGPHYLDEI